MYEAPCSGCEHRKTLTSPPWVCCRERGWSHRRTCKTWRTGTTSTKSSSQSQSHFGGTDQRPERGEGSRSSTQNWDSPSIPFVWTPSTACSLVQSKTVPLLCCAMVDHNVFHVAPRLEDKNVITVRRVKERLWAFYTKWKRDNPGGELTELQDLIPTMLGTDAHKNLAVKAMETKCLLPFCQRLLEEFAPALPSELADCSAGIGTCMARYLHLLRTELMVARPEALQDMCDTIARMLRLRKITGLRVKPKLHLLMHLVHRTEHLGNPAWSTRA